VSLKSGDSYLKKRQSDGAEEFQIKNPRWADNWQQQAYAVMLVIRTSDVWDWFPSPPVGVHGKTNPNPSPVGWAKGWWPVGPRFLGHWCEIRYPSPRGKK
jgi:hypothetical protein